MSAGYLLMQVNQQTLINDIYTKVNVWINSTKVETIRATYVQCGKVPNQAVVCFGTIKLYGGL